MELCDDVDWIQLAITALPPPNMDLLATDSFGVCTNYEPRIHIKMRLAYLDPHGKPRIFEIRDWQSG
jgi:hypothetical protein